MYNPLYNEVYEYVRKTLDTRAKSYLGDDPKKGYTNTTWAHGKLAYCYIESLCDQGSVEDGKVVARIGHTADNLGGYGYFKNEVSGFEHETMYRTNYAGSEKDAKSLSRFIKDDGLKETFKNDYFKDSKYGRGNIPAIPQLRDVSITNEGKMGSLQKVSFSFTIQDATQFDVYEELFMRPGRELRVRYGWNVSAKADNNSNSVGTRFDTDINCADYDVFTGIVYNTSWNVNSDLGYDCSVDVVGEGFFAINAETTVTNDDGSTYQDGNYELKQLDLKSQLQGDIATIDESGQKPFPDGQFVVGNNNPQTNRPIVYYKKNQKTSELKSSQFNFNPLDFGNKKIRVVSSVGAKVEDPTEHIIYYISLNELSNYLSDRILSNIGRSYTVEREGEQTVIKGNNKDIRLVSDLERSRKNGNICENEKILCSEATQKRILDDGVTNPIPAAPFVQNLRSANPNEVILPGEINGTYGDTFHFAKPEKIPGFSKEYKHRFEKDQNDKPYTCGDCRMVNLGEILISVDTVIEIYDSLSESQDVPLNQAITSFYNKLFNLISKHTGGIYQLTLVTREIESSVESIKKKRIINTIVDKNFTGCDKIDPYIFTPRVYKSLIRDFSMSSKLPSATQTAMYAGGRTKISQNVASADAFSKLQERYLSGACGGVAEESEDKGETEEDIRKKAEELKKQKNEPKKQSSAEAAIRGALKSLASWSDRLDIMLELIGRSGVNDVYVSELQLIMRRLKSNPEEFITVKEDNVNKMAGSWIGRTIYPLEFQLTIDGISGFRFGNVVTCDWLPKKYRWEDGANSEIIVTFVVTKVSHKISGYDWSTTLETQCRVGRASNGG